MFGDRSDVYQTAVNGSSSFKQHVAADHHQTAHDLRLWLPDGGDPRALEPSGETQPGWWKIEYTVQRWRRHDTWMVNIRAGNPVHLVVP